MSDMINIKDERFWDILFDEACVEGEQAERIEKELEHITVEPVCGEWLNGMTCSNCGQVDYTRPNFCSTCGCDMRGEKND